MFNYQIGVVQQLSLRILSLSRSLLLSEFGDSHLTISFLSANFISFRTLLLYHSQYVFSETWSKSQILSNECQYNGHLTLSQGDFTKNDLKCGIQSTDFVCWVGSGTYRVIRGFASPSPHASQPQEGVGGTKPLNYCHI